MSIKICISYTHEWELKRVKEMLAPILNTGCECKVINGTEYSRCYIPQKGGIDMETLKIK